MDGWMEHFLVLAKCGCQAIKEQPSNEIDYNILLNFFSPQFDLFNGFPFVLASCSRSDKIQGSSRLAL